MRVPRPVLMKPLAIRKANPISQMIELPKPLREFVIDSTGSPGAKTCVAAQNVIPIIAIVPIGAAFNMIPIIVAIKMANKCQAFAFNPAGTGINQMVIPNKIVTKSAMALISFTTSS